MKQTWFNPGKLLLFGEHAAVYGYPALGIALSDGIHLTIDSENRRAWVPPHLPGVDDAEWSRFFDHVEQTAAAVGLEERERNLRGTVTLEADLPISGGFGSSAALCAALARALTGPDDVRTDAIAQWNLANDLERFFHGTPSGIDTGLSVLGGVQLFQFRHAGELPTATALPAPTAAFLVGSVPRSGNTRELVGRIRTAYNAGDEATRTAMERLGACTDSAVEVLRAGGAAGPQSVRLGKIADTAQGILRELDLSTPSLEAALEAGRNAGARGGKLSGAGGGGAFYLVFGSAGEAESARPYVSERLRAAGELAAAGALFVLNG